MTKQILSVQNLPVSIIQFHKNDYISLTDIAKSKNNSTRAADVIKNWLRNRSTLEFLSTWELIHNQNFKVVESDHFKNQSGLHTFTLSIQEWINKTQAIGLISKPGRYGGTYAHKDIAFEFGSAINPIFKLHLITEFQRLKTEENKRLNQDWNLSRALAKINYHFQTEAIKDKIIPRLVTFEQVSHVYAHEADLLNVALFGCTAQQWRKSHPEIKNPKINLRDSATLEQLIVLSNLESLNSVLIHQNLSQSQRLIQLNQVAIRQLNSLLKKIKLELSK